jgi:putative NADH-flavin reductase
LIPEQPLNPRIQDELRKAKNDKLNEGLEEMYKKRKLEKKQNLNLLDQKNKLDTHYFSPKSQEINKDETKDTEEKKT